MGPDCRLTQEPGHPFPHMEEGRRLGRCCILHCSSEMGRIRDPATSAVTNAAKAKPADLGHFIST